MKFSYTGMLPDKTVKKGVIRAENEKEARKLIKGQGVEVILLKAKGGASMNQEISFGHISDTNLLFFVKHLSIMLKSGIALYEALNMMKSQAEGRMKKVLGKVLDRVSAGETLADALGRYPKDFPELFVQLIGSGEYSGTLEDNLAYIGEFMHKEIDLKKKVKGAMLYPAIVFIAVFVLTMGIGLFVLPQILPLFSSLNVLLPWSTRLLLWFAEFFKAYGLFVVPAMIAFAVVTPIVLELKWMRPFSHWIYLKTPLAGKIIRQLTLARFFRVLATLMEAGLPIDEALSIARKIIRNVTYKRKIMHMQKSVMKGNDLAKMMAQEKSLFPPLVAHMLQVGERSGNLADSMSYLGNYYEAEVDDRLKNLSTLLEPFLLVFIGSVVAFVAFSIIGPIYSLSGGIG